MSDRSCDWCGLALGLQRRDARFCGVVCRQAMHRELKRRKRIAEPRAVPAAATLMLIADRINNIRHNLAGMLRDAPNKKRFDYQMKLLHVLDDEIRNDLCWQASPATGDASAPTPCVPTTPPAAPCAPPSPPASISWDREGEELHKKEIARHYEKIEQLRGRVGDLERELVATQEEAVARNFDSEHQRKRLVQTELLVHHLDAKIERLEEGGARDPYPSALLIARDLDTRREDASDGSLSRSPTTTDIGQELATDHYQPCRCGHEEFHHSEGTGVCGKGIRPLSDLRDDEPTSAACCPCGAFRPTKTASPRGGAPALWTREIERPLFEGLPTEERVFDDARRAQA